MKADVKVEVLSVEEDDEPWEPVDRQQQDLDEEAGEDLGSGSDTSSSSEEEQAAVTHAARMVSAPKAPAGTELRQHPKSRMLHLIQEDHKRYLLCGRKVEMANGSLYKPPAVSQVGYTLLQPLLAGFEHTAHLQIAVKSEESSCLAFSLFNRW